MFHFYCCTLFSSSSAILYSFSRVQVVSVAHWPRKKSSFFTMGRPTCVASDKYSVFIFEYARSPTVRNICNCQSHFFKNYIAWQFDAIIHCVFHFRWSRISRRSFFCHYVECEQPGPCIFCIPHIHITCRNCRPVSVLTVFFCCARLFRSMICNMHFPRTTQLLSKNCSKNVLKYSGGPQSSLFFVKFVFLSTYRCSCP